MIIPVRCFTCNKLIGDKYEKYLEMIKTKKLENNYLNDQDEKINHDCIFNKLKLKRYCCRRIFLSHIDLLEILKA